MGIFDGPNGRFTVRTVSGLCREKSGWTTLLLLESEESQGVLAEDLVAVPLGQEGKGSDVPDRSCQVTDREGRVAADEQAVDADAGEPGEERGLVVRDRVEVEALDRGFRRALEAERGAEVLFAHAEADGD